MKVRRSRWENDPVRGRNRVLKNPNQLTPEMLWNQHRLATVDVVTPTVPRGSAASGVLPEGAESATPAADDFYRLTPQGAIDLSATCTELSDYITNRTLRQVDYTVSIWNMTKWVPGDEYTLEATGANGFGYSGGPYTCAAAKSASFSTGTCGGCPDPRSLTFSLEAGSQLFFVSRTGTFVGRPWTVFANGNVLGA